MLSGTGAARLRSSVPIGPAAAAAALVGGAAWVVKAGVILATGDEPPLAFVVGLVLFPFASLGLWWTVRDARGGAVRIGGLAAAVAATCAVLMLVVRAIGGEGVEPREDEATVLTPFITLAAVGTVMAMVALGLAVRRRDALPRRYASLPLALGLATIPLLASGAALEGIDERLFELPIGVLGLGWMALGAAMWASAGRGHAPSGEAPRRRLP